MDWGVPQCEDLVSGVECRVFRSVFHANFKKNPLITITLGGSIPNRNVGTEISQKFYRIQVALGLAIMVELHGIREGIWRSMPQNLDGGAMNFVLRKHFFFSGML